MKGKVLDFNTQTQEGVISGEDSQRYTFTQKEWKSSSTAAAAGINVDFQAEDSNATGIYAEATEAPIENTGGSEDTLMAKIVYIGLMVGFIIPFGQLISVIIAYVKNGSGPTWLNEHYRYQIRTFWIGALYLFISIILMFLLIGYITIIVTIVWYIMRCVKGLGALGRNEAPQKVDAWLF